MLGAWAFVPCINIITALPSMMREGWFFSHYFLGVYV